MKKESLKRDREEVVYAGHQAIHEKNSDNNDAHDKGTHKKPKNFSSRLTRYNDRPLHEKNKVNESGSGSGSGSGSEESDNEYPTSQPIKSFWDLKKTLVMKPPPRIKSHWDLEKTMVETKSSPRNGNTDANATTNIVFSTSEQNNKLRRTSFKYCPSLTEDQQYQMEYSLPLVLPGIMYMTQMSALGFILAGSIVGVHALQTAMTDFGVAEISDKYRWKATVGCISISALVHHTIDCIWLNSLITTMVLSPESFSTTLDGDEIEAGSGSGEIDPGTSMAFYVGILLIQTLPVYLAVSYKSYFVNTLIPLEEESIEKLRQSKLQDQEHDQEQKQEFSTLSTPSRSRQDMEDTMGRFINTCFATYISITLSVLIGHRLSSIATSGGLISFVDSAFTYGGLFCLNLNNFMLLSRYRSIFGLEGKEATTSIETHQVMAKNGITSTYTRTINDYESLGYGMTKNLPRVGSEVSIHNCNHDRIGSNALISTVRSSSTTLASSQLGDANEDKNEGRKTRKRDNINKTEETPLLAVTTVHPKDDGEATKTSKQGRRRHLFRSFLCAVPHRKSQYPYQ